MKRSFHSLVILATGSALLFASVGCERKQRAPANKTSGAANAEKPGTGSSDKSGTSGGTTIAKQDEKPAKLEPKISAVNQAMAELSKQYVETGVQSIVVIKGTKNVEKFAVIKDGKSSEYELNVDAFNKMMEGTYSSELKTAQTAKAAQPEETALAQAKLKANSALTNVINSMNRISESLAQKIDGMDDANREAEKKRLNEIVAVLKTTIEKEIPAFKSTAAPAQTETVPDSDLDDAAGDDA